jgi:queuosine precursor transporter
MDPEKASSAAFQLLLLTIVGSHMLSAMKPFITDPIVAANKPSKYLSILGMLWLTFLLITMFTAVKTFSIGSFVLNVAILAYPFTYIFADIFTEVYGYRVTRRIVWTGFVCVFIASIVTYLYSIVPSSPSFTNNEAFSFIFKTSPAIAFATIAAFFGGEMVNSFVLAKLKIFTQGSFVWLRLIGSTAAGQFVDNTLFFGIAYMAAGAFELRELIPLTLNTAIFATAWEVIALPVTYRIIRYLKHQEGLDTYDHGTNFNPFKFN